MPQPPITDLDQGFVGVNGRTDPALTQQGLVSSAKNRRFIKGVATTRRGVKILPWSNKASGYWTVGVHAEGTIVRYSGLKITASGGGDDNTAVLTTTERDTDGGVSPSANAGPSSNRIAGPYFKKKGGSENLFIGEHPVTAYADNTSLVTTAYGLGVAPSVTVSTAWDNMGALVFKYGTVYGAGVFRTPNDIEWLVVATTTGIFITQENNASEELKVDGKTYAATADATQRATAFARH